MSEFVRLQTAEGPRFAQVKPSHYALLDAAPWDGGTPNGRALTRAAAQPLVPLQPSKILGIGKNYRDHAKEMGGEVPTSPLVFLKPPSALLLSGGVVALPAISDRVDFEAELGVVIGARTRNVSVTDALKAVFGYLPVCDITARDLQKSDGQWARAKGFDGFCPVGPIVSTARLDPQDLSVQLWQNGVLQQDGNTRDMVFSVAELISHLSQAMTLEPGDLIATGTPAGVGPLNPGDTIAMRIGSLPELHFSVAGE